MRNPDRGAMLGLILLLPLVAAAQVDLSLAPGRILIADKDLHDPNFEHTVILLLSYDEDDGAGGVILNRPSETSVSEALKEYPEARGHMDSAYEGGPVQTKRVLALLHSKTKFEDADELVPGVYSVGTTKLLRKALAGKLDIRVFAGYAGWGPGQLEAEVDAGAWHVERGVATTVFDDDPESLWPRLTRKLDTQIAGANLIKAKLKYKNALSFAPLPGSVSTSDFLHQVSAAGANRIGDSTAAAQQ
jgi:putative transcriptional regulator